MPRRVAAALWLLAAAARGAAYDRCRVLDCAQNARLSWTINYSGGFIEVAMQAKGMGYVAVGIAPGAVMQGDIIVGWIPSMSSPSQGVVRDYSASTRAAPRLDARQDVTFVSSSMLMDAGGLTSITWRRALNTSDPDDAPITPGRAQSVMWASNPNAGAVTAPDGSALQRHLSNTRGIVSLDFGAPSSCVDVCGPSGPRRIDTVRATQCLGNGWTPLEAAGDSRDGGAARPMVVETRTRNVTRLVALNVTASPSVSGSASPAGSGTPTGSPPPSGSPTGTASTGASGSATPPASLSASGSRSPAASGTSSATTTAAASSGAPTASPSPAAAGAAPPDAVAAPLYQSPDGVSFRAAWAPSRVQLPNGSSVPGLVFQLALGPRVGYGALGFSAGSASVKMFNADMFIAWARVRAPSAAASCSGLVECDAFVGDYTSGGETAPQLDTAVGGAASVTLLDAAVSADGTTRVTFSRPLVTGDVASARDVDLTPGRTQHGMMYAVGGAAGDAASGAVLQHTAADATPVTYDVHALATSGGGAPIVGGGGGAAARARLVALHASAMVVAYWLAMALGVALARYRHLSAWWVAVPAAGGGGGGAPLKGGGSGGPAAAPRGSGCWAACRAKQRWFSGHAYLQLGALVAALVGWAAALASAAPAGRAFNAAGTWGVHERLGASALALAVAQGVLGGLLRPALDSPHRRGWLVGHRVAGAVTLVLGTAAIFSGLLKHARVLRGPAALALGALHVACYGLWTLACEALLAASAPSAAAAGGASSSSSDLCSSAAGRSGNPRSIFVAQQRPLPAEPLGAPNGATLAIRTHALTRSVLCPAAPRAALGVVSKPPAAAAGGEELTAGAPPTSLAPAAATATLSASSVAGHRLLTAGAALTSLTACALVAVLAASSAPGAASGEAAANARRLRVASHDAASVAAAADADGSGGRALYETVWVNETVTEAYNVSVPVTAYPGGERDLCFFMSNFSVPAADTSYICRGFALPRDVYLHATEFEFLGDRTDLAHHMVAFTTWLDPSAPAAWGLTDLGGGAWDCASGTPNAMGAAYVWAVGQDRVTLPPAVGLQVGVAPGVPVSSFAAGMTGIPFLYIQMHYNNPSRTAGLRDSSGFRMRVTTARRPIDAGLLWLGAEVSPSMAIPPGRPWYGVQADFTVPPLPPAASVNPLTRAYTMMSTFLHGHLVTRKIWVETLRGGVAQRAPDSSHAAGQNTAYNFEIQAYEAINATFQQGDVLRTRCVYTNTVGWGTTVGNTRAAAGLTVVGGEATSDEMCMAFTLYYPRIPNAATIFMTPSVPFCEDRDASGGAGGSLPSCTGFPT